MKLDTTTLAILIGLFVILSPGLLLTLPTLSQTTITDLGVSYTSGPNVETCDGTVVGEANCDKPKKILASGYTWPLAVLVHTLVFAAVLFFLVPALGIPSFTTQAVVVFSVLFGVLTPGLLLTLPPLSAVDCGETGKFISDVDPQDAPNQLFCAGVNGFPSGTAFDSTDYPNCHKCTSFWMSSQTNLLPVVVHAAVFGIVSYYIAKAYL